MLLESEKSKVDAIVATYIVSKDAKEQDREIHWLILWLCQVFNSLECLAF
jgi:hypothetical protein